MVSVYRMGCQYMVETHKIFGDVTPFLQVSRFNIYVRVLLFTNPIWMEQG